MEASTLADAEHGLVAKGRVFFYFKIGDLKAGTGQQMQADRGHVNGTSDAGTDAGGDAALVAADIYERGKDDGGDDEQNRKEKEPVFPGWTVNAHPIFSIRGQANPFLARFHF